MAGRADDIVVVRWWGTDGWWGLVGIEWWGRVARISQHLYGPYARSCIVPRPEWWNGEIWTANVTKSR